MQQLTEQQQPLSRVVLPLPSGINASNKRVTYEKRAVRSVVAHKKWSDACAEIVDRAHRMLFSSCGKDAQTYLCNQGFSNDTIKHFKLGYMPLVNGKFSQFPFDFFGIDPATLPKAQRDKGGVNVPDGILIPWYQNGEIAKLTVLRPGQTPVYGQIVGSTDCLFNGAAIQADQPAVMCRSEIAAMLIWQEAKDLVTCVATGTEKKCRHVNCVALLNSASFVLQSFEDEDAADYWGSVLDRCMRWAPWYERAQLLAWVEAGLFSASVELKQEQTPANNFVQNQNEAIKSQRAVPLQEIESVTDCPRNKAPELPKNGPISRAEFIGALKDEVARLWGGCEMKVYPAGFTIKDRVRELRSEQLWKTPVIARR